MIALVAAMDERNLIGVGGRLPWHLPADLRHFRDVTMGKAVVMGRKTLESIGRRLDGRTCFVLSRTRGVIGGNAVVADSLAHVTDEFDEVYVIGGAQVFAQALPLADRLYLTRIAHTFAALDGAVYFPRWEGFRLTASEVRAPDEANPYSMDFQVWERR